MLSNLFVNMGFKTGPNKKPKKLVINSLVVLWESDQ